MAGKIQKPYELLQFKRGNRRRSRIVLPALPLTETDLARRKATIELATSSIERQFGAGRIERKARPPVGKRQRRYVPKAERKPNAKRAEMAAARPRDARGHFIKRERPQRQAGAV